MADKESLPLAREDAPTAKLLERHSYTADAREEIAEGKRRVAALPLVKWSPRIERCDKGAFSRRWTSIPRLPAPNGAFARRAHTKGGGELLLGEAEVNSLLRYISCI